MLKNVIGPICVFVGLYVIGTYAGTEIQLGAAALTVGIITMVAR